MSTGTPPADTELGGSAIEKGDLVIVSLTCRQPRPGDVCPIPISSISHRPNSRSHLAFAQGPHACVGIHLARLETQAALEAVLEVWPGLTLGGGLAPRRPG